MVDVYVVVISSDHVLVPVHGYVRHGFIVVFVVTVRGAEPLVEPMLQRQVLRSVAKMPGTNKIVNLLPPEYGVR